MSPERAKILHAEDNALLREFVKSLLERGGHEVVYQAETLGSALEGAKRAEELELDVAILDGNLGSRTDCSDGRTVAAALREVKPDITIISLSGSNEADYGDLTVLKDDVNSVFSLPEVIKGL